MAILAKIGLAGKEPLSNSTPVPRLGVPSELYTFFNAGSTMRNKVATLQARVALSTDSNGTLVADALEELHALKRRGGPNHLR